jgi:branched-subunit amino acid aminotransferase/4-amino-4-deoxychorismate lyase
MEAAEHDCADAVLLNDRGHITETSSGNIFWLKDGTLHTPALACGILEGATRAAILRLSPVREVEAKLEELQKSQAAFITNSVWGALPVGRLLPGDAAWDSAPATVRFQQLLTKDREKYCTLHKNDWQ